MVGDSCFRVTTDRKSNLHVCCELIHSLFSLFLSISFLTLMTMMSRSVLLVLLYFDLLTLLPFLVLGFYLFTFDTFPDDNVCQRGVGTDARG